MFEFSLERILYEEIVDSDFCPRKDYSHQDEGLIANRIRNEIRWIFMNGSDEINHRTKIFRIF